MLNRRQFLKLTAATGAGIALPWGVTRSTLPLGVLPVMAAPAAPGLSDPTAQPIFEAAAPNALDPGYKFTPSRGRDFYTVGIAKNPSHVTGLAGGLTTPVWGYGQNGEALWPGKTFEVWAGDTVQVRWENNLFGEPHLLPVDTTLHWCYSLPGYEHYTIAEDGVPVATHLHGGHNLDHYDGTPEQFFSPGYEIRGPYWRGKTFIYQNRQTSGTLWYHDHALGITRLNVYAGLAGFYIVRDELDTGRPDNPLGLPAFPYELAYAIQDRMFKANGELFYPSMEGDPFWDGFIPGEGVDVCPDDPADPDDLCIDPNEPTVLAEFFGDHMVVNGKIWPKAEVEPRHYRMRLLNGTDSRFMVLQFVAVPLGATGFDGASAALPFYVIGSDQGLASAATITDTLVFEPGSRYDVVFDFASVAGQRIIMKNIGGDEPFGGDIPGPQIFALTDRVMAFDVVTPLDTSVPDAFDPAAIAQYGGNQAGVDRVRKLALFEGTDEYGRLQPLLGTAEPATDHVGKPIYWPDEPIYQNAGLTGQMEGAIGWHSPTTENPAHNSTEIWEIYNVTEDAHPIHLHLVNFQILDRQAFHADVVPQPIVQHNGTVGQGGRLENITLLGPVDPGMAYVENAPKDMVTALPDQVTRIKATFDRPGRYVWHCHILSHEDHEMMRVLHVGGGA